MSARQLNMPVFGLAWANYKTAGQDYEKFSILHTHLPELMQYNRMQVDMYGFSQNYASSEHFDVDVYKWVHKQIKPNYSPLVQKALPLVERSAQHGARAVVIACGSPELSEFAALLDQETTREFGVKTLVPVDTMIKMAQRTIK
jgi:Asp/Glu/hydantoin racemase